MTLSEKMEYARFKTWWNMHEYRASYSEHSRQFKICWAAWKAQASYPTGSISWVPETAPAAENTNGIEDTPEICEMKRRALGAPK